MTGCAILDGSIAARKNGKRLPCEVLMAENAKLRELCEQCAIELYVNGNVTDASAEMLFDDMRELGIEVDDG